MHIRLTIAYDGSSYLGWQKTKMGPSIEEALETILRHILQEDISLEAASRTDAGVHAQGQVASFHTSKQPDLFKLHRALNGLLPKDISVSLVELAADDFHPTLHSKGKEYHYTLCLSAVQVPFDRNYSWHFPYPLNLLLMEEAAQFLMGTHDFSSFCNMRHGPPSNPIRNIQSITLHLLEGQRLRIVVKGESFLYKMVRNLVGTLVYVGCGKLSVHSIPLILNRKDRIQAGVTAPAHGLSLFKVIY